MSGLDTAVGRPSNPSGETSEDSPPAGNNGAAQEEATPRASAPRSIPDTSEGNEGEGEMVPAAGRINEKGEVVDDDGNPIGKVTEGDSQKFVGFIVTQEGDVLDEEGSVVGKAEPLGGVPAEPNYTTKPVADSDAQGGQINSGSGLGGAFSGAGRGFSQAAKTVTGPVGDTTQEDTTQDTTGNAGSAVGGVADETHQTPRGITEAPDNMAEGITDTVGGAGKDVGARDTGDFAEVAGTTAQDVIQGTQQTTDKESLADTGDMVSKVGLGSGRSSKMGDVAKQEPIPVNIPPLSPEIVKKVVALFKGPFTVADSGKITDQRGEVVGKLSDDSNPQALNGKDIVGIDGQGNLLDGNDTILGRINLRPEGAMIEKIKEEIPEAVEWLQALEAAQEQAEEPVKLPDISILEGMNINKAGNVVDDNGNPIGKVKSGDIKKLVGKVPDRDGKVWDNQGNIIGEVEALPEKVQNEAAPFENFPNATVDKFGKVIHDGRQVGVIIGDDFQKLIGMRVDADGDVLDKHGNVIGRAERVEAEEPIEPEEEPVDYSILREKKVNKLGNVVDEKGQVWGHVVQGIIKHLVGKKVGDNGEIFDDAGRVIGKAEPIPETEREEVKEPAPFEDYPDAVVGDQGRVMSNGEQVGVVVQGDPRKLKGKPVDPDGDILDKAGNQLGRAERWEEEEEPEVDRSALAGKRVNKAGNAVDSHGDVYGRVVEGDLKRLIGKYCDKNGFIRNEEGDVIGKCEIIPEAEREGMKEGPFAELPGCTVNKEGKVVTPGGDVVGRVVSGDPKLLFGRVVDDDGDICDKNGNVLGHAERWEEEPVPKEVNPMSGRRVNREGNVVDENGDIMGKLTSGLLTECAGKKIDDDGDVVDGKGNVLGHCSLLSELPEEPEETEEERLARLQLEQDKKIASQISFCIEQSLDKIKPICKMIVDRIDAEERKPEDERDEDELVKQVRPLIEEGGKILTEANGVIRGLDPDGRISANAKHKTAAREATPEEYRLADLLKELTGTVTETIEGAKRKLENLPRAKKGINPLWGLLSEPLFQIIAAVGLLLSGVLGLVGKLLNGLGLGGLVNNLLGGLGLTKVLDGLGLGTILSPITGSKKK